MATCDQCGATVERRNLWKVELAVDSMSGARAIIRYLCGDTCYPEHRRQVDIAREAGWTW